ncbi:methyltransferase tpch [Anaeramoeba flamelloides]|uniref:Methyltransferase tpch n=1 Tax=Anaeramoeba flamelloides TaxID=1746091 RepID=A0AAV7YF02_9EUKA|nr:methyltransferase tpch [Anaeramoeba flamelloides]
MENQYSELAKIYNNFIENGGPNGSYYNYSSVAESLSELLVEKPTSRILEIGAGTGSFVLKLIPKFPESHFVLIDHTEEMLNQAKVLLSKYSSQVTFICADVKTIVFEEKFDVIVSHGGVWFAGWVNGKPKEIDFYSDIQLFSHINGFEENKLALTNILKYLKPEGFLSMNVQETLGIYETVLKEGIHYSQKVELLNENQFKKQYIFKKDNKIIAHQFCVFFYMKNDQLKKFLKELNLQYIGIDSKMRMILLKKI